MRQEIVWPFLPVKFPADRGETDVTISYSGGIGGMLALTGKYTVGGSGRLEDRGDGGIYKSMEIRSDSKDNKWER